MDTTHNNVEKLIDEILQDPRVGAMTIEKGTEQTFIVPDQTNPEKSNTVEMGAWTVTLFMLYKAAGDEQEEEHPVTSWGKTLHAALLYAKDSIELVFDDGPYDGWEIPPTNHL